MTRRCDCCDCCDSERYPPPVATRSTTRANRYAKRRRKRVASRDNDLTDTQWLALQEAWGGGCAYCGADGGWLYSATACSRSPAAAATP